jgi:hypothetical protein
MIISFKDIYSNSSKKINIIKIKASSASHNKLMAMLNNLLNISKTIIPLYQKMDTFINIKISRNSNTTVRKDILVLTVLQINNKANLSIYKIHKTNLNFIEKKGNLHNLWIKMDG